MIVCQNVLLILSHINQTTQFENPVLEAKRKLGLDTAVATQNQQRAAVPPGTHTAPCILSVNNTTVPGFMGVTGKNKGARQ